MTEAHFSGLNLSFAWTVIGRCARGDGLSGCCLVAYLELAAQAQKVFVVDSPEKGEGASCTKEGHEHVPLRIPGVALCAEKGIGG